MTDRPRLLVATPCYGGLCTTAYTHSMLILQQACRSANVDLQWLLGAGDALITRARADLATAFLDIPEATHLHFVDADIGFAPEQVFRLMNFDADITAAAYPAKAIDYGLLQRAVREGRRNPQSAALNYVVGFLDRNRVESKDGFAKVRHAGTGFMMIRRAALTKICAAHPELKYSSVHSRHDERAASPNRFALFETMIDAKTGEYLSEDYAFCRRWRDLGGEIWLDLQSKLTHVGSMPFVGDLSSQFDAPAKQR